MSLLKEKLSKIIPKKRDEIKNLVKTHGDKVISEVTVTQAFGGMRGVKGLICDTSLVEPDKGLIIRGTMLKDLTEKTPEEIFWLLLTGESPSGDEIKSIKDEFSKRAKVPSYVWDVLKALPKDTHPMVMLDTAILVMENESVFRKNYYEGMKKADYWEPALEDSLNLLAKLPTVAAGLYRIKYGKGDILQPKSDKDWSENYAYMLGVDDPNGDFANLMRLYLVLHSDHEGGNVSAFTTHTVGSALSDPYYALSAGLNGLAGPLHGLANQECLKFVLDINKKFNGVPSDDDLKKFAWDTLNSGQVIPGYGHAVLRVTDPRFDAFLAFGKKYCKEDPTFQTVEKMFNLIPGVLKEHGKAKNPWPNVDAGSGCLLYKYGLKEFEYYTVLFGVSRAMGVLSQLVLSRAMGSAIVRPKSVQTNWVKKQVGA